MFYSELQGLTNRKRWIENLESRLGQPEKLKLSLLHPESPGTQSASVERETAMDAAMSNHRELKNFAKGGDAGEFSL